MGRNRGGQLGSVIPTKSGLWQGSWYEYRTGEDGKERRIHRTMVLGKRSGMHKSEAEAKLRAHIASVGYESEAAAVEAKRPARAGAVTFGWFITERYWRLKESVWRRKTRDLNRYLFEKILQPKWGGVALAALDKVEAQAWLGEIARDYSASLVDKARVYLKAVCEEAIDQGYLDRNPFRKLRMPSDLKPIDKSTLDFDQVAALIRELGNTRDRLILRLFVVGGFRRQEVFALRWDDVLGRSLRVDETVEMSEVVQLTKTKGSRALVGISVGLTADIEAWRRETERAGVRDFLFVSAVGTHIGPENWIRAALRPAAKRAGIDRINYQMLRRTFATLAPQAGISLKHISEQLRHATITTTADEYMQPVEATLLAGLDALDAAIRKRAAGGGSVPK